MQRALIIGWDGATFDLIRPWVEEEKADIETSLEPDCDDADTSGAYTAEEERVIAERLQSLGYID